MTASSGGSGEVSLSRSAWDQVRGDEVLPSFTLGPVWTESLLHDPKHLAFTLSRYKFASKMLRRCRRILEVGCGEGVGALTFVADTPADVVACDFDQSQIDYARATVAPHGKGRLDFRQHDLIAGPVGGGPFDGLVSLDVIEHIDRSEQDRFFEHLMGSLADRAVAVIGTPSELAHRYASERSRRGHINLFDPDRMATTLERYFGHVMLFSMNDEMVHTGYSKMAHYLMAVCVR